MSRESSSAVTGAGGRHFPQP